MKMNLDPIINCPEVSDLQTRYKRALHQIISLPETWELSRESLAVAMCMDSQFAQELLGEASYQHLYVLLDEAVRRFSSNQTSAPQQSLFGAIHKRANCL